ncbi:cytochrome P450 [Streptomyces sp. NPDC049954]|uniref:cytochrome P450 family protein n=1 Tax=Streptomyces sp. NPDC049954 TaxID=3155779 RepID=UPI003421A5C6
MPYLAQLPVADEALPATFARFRASGPVVPLELPAGVRAWAATTHAAVREVLDGDDRAFGKHVTHWKALNEGRVPKDWVLMPIVVGDHMLMRDGAEHRRLRRLLAKAFTPARVEGLRPRLEAITDDLLDRLADDLGGAEPTDLTALFAEPLPIAVISELFGIPEARRPGIREATRVLYSHTSTPGQAHEAHRDLVTSLRDLVQEKRHHPGDDLTTALVHARDEEQGLTEQELVDSLFLLLIAGHETSVHMLGHALVHLLRHPDQLASALAGDRWDAVVDETLRLNPPVAASVFRYALRDVRVAGVTIPAGDPVLLCLGGAATDPEHHGPDVDRFDIAREQRGHLAFGHGPHFCLGAPLARLEGRTALSRLFRRFPGLTLACSPEDVPYSPSFLTYGPLSVPVRA